MLCIHKRDRKKIYGRRYEAKETQLMNEPLAISAKHVADLLDVSTRQVWAMHASGSLGPPPIKLSDRLSRWDSGEIEAWWKACRAAGRIIGRQEWIRRQSD